MLPKFTRYAALVAQSASIQVNKRFYNVQPQYLINDLSTETESGRPNCAPKDPNKRSRALFVFVIALGTHVARSLAALIDVQRLDTLDQLYRGNGNRPCLLELYCCLSACT